MDHILRELLVNWESSKIARYYSPWVSVKIGRHRVQQEYRLKAFKSMLVLRNPKLGTGRVKRQLPGKGQHLVVGDCFKQKEGLKQIHGSKSKQEAGR